MINVSVLFMSTYSSGDISIASLGDIYTNHLIALDISETRTEKLINEEIDKGEKELSHRCTNYQN